MGIFLYLKSRKHYELITEIRLTCSKNGTTGTAICEIKMDQMSHIHNSVDPIYGIGIKKQNSCRLADICQFVWGGGKPIKIIAIFFFSNVYDKQEFFNYYSYYALKNRLEFLPASMQEDTLNNLEI